MCSSDLLRAYQPYQRSEVAQSRSDVFDTGLAPEDELGLIRPHPPRLPANQDESFDIKLAHDNMLLL